MIRFELYLHDVRQDCRLLFETEEAADAYAIGRGSKDYAVADLRAEPCACCGARRGEECNADCFGEPDREGAAS